MRTESASSQPESPFNNPGRYPACPFAGICDLTDLQVLAGYGAKTPHRQIRSKKSISPKAQKSEPRKAFPVALSHRVITSIVQEDFTVGITQQDVLDLYTSKRCTTYCQYPEVDGQDPRWHMTNIFAFNAEVSCENIVTFLDSPPRLRAPQARNMTCAGVVMCAKARHTYAIHRCLH